jgi:hypothetical protein
MGQHCKIYRYTVRGNCKRVSINADPCDCATAVFVYSTQGAILKAAKNGAVLLVVCESVGALRKVLGDLNNVAADAKQSELQPPMVVNVIREDSGRILYFVLWSYLNNGKRLLEQVMYQQPAALQAPQNEPWAFSAFARVLGSAGNRDTPVAAASASEHAALCHTVVVLGTDKPQNRLLQMSIGSALSKPTGCLVITATEDEQKQVREYWKCAVCTVSYAALAHDVGCFVCFCMLMLCAVCCVLCAVCCVLCAVCLADNRT